jgi:hypothetical protein
MTDVMRIRDTVSLSLSTDFLASGDPRGLAEINLETDLEAVDCQADLEAVDSLVTRVIENHEHYDTAMDGVMAIPLHRALPLTRRQAADRRLWAWLGIVRYPHFVAHRWAPGRPDAEGICKRAENRFQGNSVRQAFARLWWSAELTVTGEADYALTEELLSLTGLQDAYEAMFGRAFCQYRPGLAAFIEVVGPQPANVIREAAKEFSYLLTTEVLEVTPHDRLTATLREIVTAVQHRLAA